MAQSGHFNDLGERILEDLRSLEVIFRDRPHEQIEMRSIIKLVEKEWFFPALVRQDGETATGDVCADGGGSWEVAKPSTCCSVRRSRKLLDTMGV